ncbi:hypothetical protein [Natrinema sp. H-ect4]
MTGTSNSSIWECPECGRSVNRFVNGYRCPSCRETVSERRDCGTDATNR